MILMDDNFASIVNGGWGRRDAVTHCVHQQRRPGNLPMRSPLRAPGGVLQSSLLAVSPPAFSPPPGPVPKPPPTSSPSARLCRH